MSAGRRGKPGKQLRMCVCLTRRGPEAWVRKGGPGVGDDSKAIRGPRSPMDSSQGFGRPPPLAMVTTESRQVCGSLFESYIAVFHSRCGDALVVRQRPLPTWLIYKSAGGPPIVFVMSVREAGPDASATRSACGQHGICGPRLQAAVSTSPAEGAAGAPACCNLYYSPL